MFAPVKPGGWAFGELLSSAHMNQLDADHANALDALNGGAYTLVAPLSIDGDVTVTTSLTAPNMVGPTELAGDLTVTDEATISGSLTVGENLNVTENLHCLGEVETQRLQVNFLSVFADEATFEAQATFEDDVSVAGELTTAAAVTLGGSGVISIGNGGLAHVELNSPTSIYQPLRPQAGGFITKRLVTGANANASYGPKNWDEVFLPAGVLSADRVYTIDDTDALDGAAIRFVSFDPTNRARINQPDGTLIIYVKFASAVTTAYDVELRRIAGIWTLLGTKFL